MKEHWTSIVGSTPQSREAALSANELISSLRVVRSGMEIGSTGRAVQHYFNRLWLLLAQQEQVSKPGESKEEHAVRISDSIAQRRLLQNLSHDFFNPDSTPETRHESFPGQAKAPGSGL